jgi:hypothetical protein
MPISEDIWKPGMLASRILLGDATATPLDTSSSMPGTCTWQTNAL